jgi:hypothetical protein
VTVPRLQESKREECSAPGCASPVEVVVVGVDFDGTPFRERTCGSCGIYLVEAGGEMRPVREQGNV